MRARENQEERGKQTDKRPNALRYLMKGFRGIFRGTRILILCGLYGCSRYKNVNTMTKNPNLIPSPSELNWPSLHFDSINPESHSSPPFYVRFYYEKKGSPGSITVLIHLTRPAEWQLDSPKVYPHVKQSTRELHL